ncbi:GlsB/YeaQ/YmgE family stress response membrane protein [Bacteroidota bacterium]
MSLVYIILVGLVAGWLAGLIMKGKGFGFLLNIIVGILGAIVGRWLVFEVFSFDFAMNTINQIIVAVVGAVFLLLLVGILRSMFR